MNPRIVEAIREYPAFYYGGAVGPDGLPEIVMGQAIVHPESTGIWISHVLDLAWEAQGPESPYSPEEQSGRSSPGRTDSPPTRPATSGALLGQRVQRRPLP